MALKDTSDDLRRFRSAAYQPNRGRPTMDIRRPARHTFPTVGKSLPPQQPMPTHTVPPISATPLSTAPPRSSRSSAVTIVKKQRKIVTKKRILFVCLLLLLAGGGWLGSKVLTNAARIFHGSVFSVLTTTKLKGEDTGRVNILLAGNSADDAGHNGANLTDSIMVVSIDTKDNSAFMLSIPRDTWVSIPGYGHAKINEAYVDGEAGNFSAPGYPNGGMGLLEEVVHHNFNLTLNYYALINYSALRDAVNSVGGIPLNVQSSDPRGLYDPSIDYATHGPLVRLTNGQHVLNGEQALDLARARGDAYGSYGFADSDFERTQNQRLMMIALKSKIMTAGVLANPVALANLFDSLGKNVKTDLSLSEARRMYDLGKNINNGSIQSVSLNMANGKNLLANYSAPNGESALIPAAGLDNFSQIQAFVARLTTNNAVVRENATVTVLNGTNTVGLAAKAQGILVAKAVNVVSLGDAHSATTQTTIIDASSGKDPATLQLLKQLYGNNVTTVNPYANTYATSFIVVLGVDQATPATATSP